MSCSRNQVSTFDVGSERAERAERASEGTGQETMDLHEAICTLEMRPFLQNIPQLDDSVQLRCPYTSAHFPSHSRDKKGMWQSK